MPESLLSLTEAVTENQRLRDALEATLLFHSGGKWDYEKAHRWFNITQTPTCTGKSLCNHIRAVMDGKDYADIAVREEGR